MREKRCGFLFVVFPSRHVSLTHACFIIYFLSLSSLCFFLFWLICAQLSAKSEQIEQLSRDLERERRLKTGDKALRNTEYLKHALLKWMLTNDRQQQQQLLPVIAEMLQFSTTEANSVRDALGRGFLRRVWGGGGGN
jgi:hypothetical protein